jgi:hypothetical protein
MGRGRPKGSGALALPARFWRHVDRGGFDECWPWTGAPIPAKGCAHLFYGAFSVYAGELEGVVKRGNQRAHRVAFYLTYGRWPVPYGLHGCDNGLCCNAENPEHVHEGTAAQNTAEMFARGRGHPPPLLRGEHSSRAKLTDKQALDIIARYQAGGVFQAELAAEYGVSQPAISSIIRGRRRSLQ